MRRLAAASLIALAAAMGSAPPSTASPSASDLAAAHALRQAEDRLLTGLHERLGAIAAAEASADAAIARECAGILKGAPGDGRSIEIGGSRSEHESSRADGEQARSVRARETITEEIAAAVDHADHAPVRATLEAFSSSLEALSFSDPAVTAAARYEAAVETERLAAAQPSPCADMRAWAASGFKSLSPASKAFRAAREALDREAPEVPLESLLSPYEVNASERALGRRVETERKRLEDARASRSLASHRRLVLALGQTEPAFVEQLFQPVIARGRTHIGTPFAIRRALREADEPHPCPHAVFVELSNRLRVLGFAPPSGRLCLGRQRTAPRTVCVSGTETVDLATVPQARSVRIRLAGGRTLSAHVIPIPARDGGPGGVFVDAFRGRGVAGDSLQVLDAHGGVLARHSFRGCAAEKTRGATERPPNVLVLTHALTPQGDPLAIAGLLEKFGRRPEFFLVPARGEMKYEVGEESTPPRQFQWMVSSECAPHRYALIEGTLKAPGVSVLVRTPSGLAPLQKAPTPPNVVTAGPVFYGVFESAPSEVIVERADWSTLYSESLAGFAGKEAEFCEGLAEP